MLENFLYPDGVIGGEKEGEKERDPRIPSQILGVSSVGIRRIKS